MPNPKSSSADAFAENLYLAFHNPKGDRQIVQPCPFANLKGSEQDGWRAVARTATFALQMSIGASMIESAKATLRSGAPSLELISAPLPTATPEALCDVCGNKRSADGSPCHGPTGLPVRPVTP